MPRLRQVSRSETDDPFVLSMYDYLFGDRDPVTDPGTSTGTPGDWWTTVALVPDVLRHSVRGFALYRSPDRLLRPALRELAQARAGWSSESQFVYSQHLKSGRGVGISEEKLAGIAAWEVATCFDEAERAVLAYTDALVRGGRVSDGVFDALHAHLSDEEIIELHLHHDDVHHACDHDSGTPPRASRRPGTNGRSLRAVPGDQQRHRALVRYWEGRPPCRFATRSST